RTPAPSRAPGSTRALGWIASLTDRARLAGLAAQLRQPLLERAPALQQLGQSRLGNHDAPGEPDGPRRRAEHLRAGLDAAPDPRLVDCHDGVHARDGARG